MKIGIPEGLLYHRYKIFIKRFVEELGIDAIFSGESDQEIMERGIETCVDEACLPIKVFHGHVSRLREECDKIVVPRLMKCEFGDSICPKFSGLPELIRSGSGKDDLVFTKPLFLNNKKKTQQIFMREAKDLGINNTKARKAFNIAYEDCTLENRKKSYSIAGEKLKLGNAKREPIVVLLGHPYNVMDSFVNMNLKEKLKSLSVKAIAGDKLSIHNRQFSELMKKPYWRFFRDNYSVAKGLINKEFADGVIYLSSFNCGTDSFTIEMIRNVIGEFPMLVLKLDEHTGEAGFNTRIEAFVEILQRRKEHEAYFSKVGR